MPSKCGAPARRPIDFPAVFPHKPGEFGAALWVRSRPVHFARGAVFVFEGLDSPCRISELRPRAGSGILRTINTRRRAWIEAKIPRPTACNSIARHPAANAETVP
ncbi:hypothetical protein QO011_005576 [Labrys wisconsinensis]|uniref:Uncharacterized protein n=1 Tax=Labrys wisconsinensis TaxID=425677 RepID=A0ABU0JHG4_9HYPH|nr:hypothetical protein [Labrys wisconsinensis]